MKKLQKLTLAALLTAAGLVVFVIEAQLPPLTAIPGIKPGLSNVFTMLTLFWVGPGWALGTMFVRVSLGSPLTRPDDGIFLQLIRRLCGVPCRVGASQAAWRTEALGTQRIRRDGAQSGADGGGGLHQPHKRNFVLSSGPAGFRHCDRDFYRSVRAARIKRARQAGLFSK